MAELNRYCDSLHSTKVTERTKACDYLIEVIEDKSTVALINEGGAELWTGILTAIEHCITQDAHKRSEGFKAQGYFARTTCFKSADVYSNYIRVAMKEGISLNFSKIVNFIIETLQDDIIKTLLEHYLLKILSDSILVDSKSRSNLNKKCWEDLFVFLKSSCENKNPSTTNEPVAIKCMALVIKWGPLYTLPIGMLRQEFAFITRFCGTASPKTPKPQNEAILEIVYEFCLHTSKDSRMSCCKLGEDVFLNLKELYEFNTKEDMLKIQLINFFLLQVAVHNPKGATQEHPVAYAVSWNTWHECLRGAYYVVQREIEINMGSVKKSPIFTKTDGIHKMQKPFVCLFVEVYKQLMNINSAVNESDEPPKKRPKTEIGIKELIDRIQETQFWPWINFTYALLRTYPEVIRPVDYLPLLRVLSRLQIDCKNPDLKYHLYKALITMEALQIEINDTNVETLWITIGKNILRSVGANDKQSQELLCALIRRNVIQGDVLFQNYRSKVMHVTPHNLKTLIVALHHFKYAQSDSDLKKDLIMWIMNADLRNNLLCLRTTLLSNFIVYLSLKQWPELVETRKKISKKRQFDDIEIIYLSTYFENLLIETKESTNTAESTLKTYCLDMDLYMFLIESLKQFVTDCGDCTGNPEMAISLLMFVFNITADFLSYDLLKDGKGGTLMNIFDSCAALLSSILHSFRDLISKPDDRHLTKLGNCVRLLKDLFDLTSNASLATKLRSFVSTELVRSMFDILLIEDKESKYDSDVSPIFRNMKTNAVATIASFAWIPTSSGMTEMQKRALNALLQDDYDVANDLDFELVMTLLSSIKQCSPDFIDETTLLSIYNLIQNICQARYTCYFSVKRILELIYDLYPLVVSYKSEICTNQFIVLLYPFYTKRQSYGPEISVLLLNCMGLIYELNPNSQLARWDNEEVVFKIPESLTSDYQTVRFAAVKNLAKFFTLSSESRQLCDFHRQEIMFSNLYTMSVKVFEIEGDLQADQIVDETVTRTSSVLHTYISVIASSYLWANEALYSVFSIVVKQKIHIEEAKEAIKLVAKHFGFNSVPAFLEKHLFTLYSKWKTNEPDSFPISIIGCHTKMEFYHKFWTVLAPVIIESDVDSISEIALSSEKGVLEIVEESTPKLLTYCLAKNASDLGTIQTDKVYAFVTKTIGLERMKQIARNRVDDVLLSLIVFVYDEHDYLLKYQTSVLFSKHEQIVLSVPQFLDCLKFIEAHLLDNSNVVQSMLRDFADKIHLVFLRLKFSVCATSAHEDKLRHFHLYSLFTILVLEDLRWGKNLQIYIMRDIIYTLLHFIKSPATNFDLCLLGCKFFKIVLAIILPQFADILKHFFLMIVSTLKNISLKVPEISQHCIELLNILVVDHAAEFTDEISKLDAFPSTDKFHNIYKSHCLIKYSKQISLNDEIQQFLDFAQRIESLDECEDGLKHLRTLLSSKENKTELKLLYETLESTRGFSEDCKNSLLHQLICILIKLSCSGNKNVSLEAVRCLGEIGPGDLTTLVLEPEKPISNTKWTPWELISGHIISLLCKYIIDGDVRVIKEASNALFKVLDTKEGKKVTESEFDTGSGVICSDYLTPFFPKLARRTSFNIGINRDIFIRTIQDDELWTPQTSSHQCWITNLLCSLLETFSNTEYFATLITVCKLKVEFCETLLPLIVFVSLETKDQNVFCILESQIKHFFNEHWRITVVNKDDGNKTIAVNKASVQCMLNVVNFIRLQNHAKTKRQQDLKLNFLKIAKAAQFCTAQFTALLYAELWCQKRLAASPAFYEDSVYGLTKLDMIYEKEDDVVGKALQDILRKAYKAIGEVDALLGCGTSCLLNTDFRVEYYKELNKWEQVVHHYDMKVSHGSTSSLTPLMEGLKNCNLYQLSLYCSNFNQEPDYESLWRLGQWNFSQAKTNDCNTNLTKESYEKYKFFAFKHLHDSDDFNFKKSIDNIRSCIVSNLFDVSLESSKNFYSILTELQSFKELEDFSQAVMDNNMDELLEKWKLQDDIIKNDFVYLEPIKTQRIALLTEFLQYSHRDGLWIVLVDMILKFAEYSRIEGHWAVAQRTLTQLRHNIPTLSHDVKARVQIEEAQLCWQIRDIVTAKCILRNLCANEEVSPKIHAMALLMTGKWLVESSSENRQTIIENYFLKSISMLRDAQLSPTEHISEVDTYIQLARFADHEYQQVMAHIKSDVFQKKIETMEKVQQELKDVRDINKLPKDLRKSMSLKLRQSKIDESEIKNIEAEKNNLLKLALKYYMLNLLHSDHHNIAIFRLISLFLENRQNQVAKSVLEKELLKLPTYKFISILPQLIPHIAGNDFLAETVNKILLKCGRDHPYHTLPPILSLVYAYKDQAYTESKTCASSDRSQCAKLLLNKLKNSSVSDLIKNMELLSEALIELAYVKVPDGNRENVEIKIPQKCKIRKIKNFDNVLVPTVLLGVNKSCVYDEIIGINSFSQGYYTVGGINAPKRIYCRGTDGIERTQLVKGQDDLRQDAVMQQVFTIMNGLLAGNKETKQLLIRTYKIVPLSMRSGILEWVDNSMPLTDYLVGEKGSGGAHVLYRPSDDSPAKCRNEFRQAANKSTTEEKLRIYKKICQNIKPVFHKFFENSFPHPTVWYERRRAYIRSVATTSMCGYILGLGDRHVSNILIDKSTAEVIHIDFGIAFEQGRLLPTPETVPFRLTRDVVDGMGVSGVEGVFRRSCEKTVEVLRRHYQTIITILEVLLYDPLYDWIVSTVEANKRQLDDADYTDYQGSDSSEEDAAKVVNVTAERALLRLKAKLQGTENGNPTTVEHQVGTLIQQAMDPSNLCRLFQGWQPYL